MSRRRAIMSRSPGADGHCSTARRLAAVEEALGPGFARIHRGQLVRRAAIRRIETDRSGDFTVTLEGGTALRGSRRYRAGLQA